MSATKPSQLRLGLCCQFSEQPIKFRTTTARAMLGLSEANRLDRLSSLCHDNAQALRQAIEFCAQNDIGAFRVNSQILPLKTHPDVGYEVEQLPDAERLIEAFRDCGQLAQSQDIRLSFHPDQFVVLNSPKESTRFHSRAELVYQTEVAAWIGADCINVHGGGAYGDKPSALSALRRGIERLPEAVRSKLTLENDDRVYTPSDLLPVCRDVGVPLVYDVHHHRCLPDGLSVGEASTRARQTWPREPLFHLSSPKDGWHGAKPSRHHDFIDVADFPQEWLGWKLTVDVEAKAKEVAVGQLRKELTEQYWENEE